MTALQVETSRPSLVPSPPCRQQAIDEVGTPACSWASLGCNLPGSGTGGMSPVSIDGAEPCTGQGKPLAVPVLLPVRCPGPASVHACLRGSPGFFKMKRHDSPRLRYSSQGQRCPGWRSFCGIPSSRRATGWGHDAERDGRESLFVRLCHPLSAGRVCRCLHQSRLRGAGCLVQVLGGTSPGQALTWRS